MDARDIRIRLPSNSPIIHGPIIERPVPCGGTARGPCDPYTRGMSTLFDDGGGYAAHRPTYPAELARSLAELPWVPGSALDVGCGTGQLTELLSARFGAVTGIDPSPSQINAAITGSTAANVDYLVGAAEHLPLGDGRVDLVVVAQAAHWIDDLAAFYEEVRRVAAPGGVIALVSYGVCHLEGELDSIFQDFYWGDFHRFWDPRRKHVEHGLAELEFPFPPLPVAPTRITAHHDLPGFLGYLDTWTAAEVARESGHAHELAAFA